MKATLISNNKIIRHEDESDRMLNNQISYVSGGIKGTRYTCKTKEDFIKTVEKDNKRTISNHRKNIAMLKKQIMELEKLNVVDMAKDFEW